MTDIVSEKKRSEMMAAVRQKNTKPEILLRKLLHRKGLRYRLHAKGLPGKPDLVFPKYGTVVFVHGCFWHQHEGCRRARRPSTRKEWWDQKLQRNMDRDQEKEKELADQGWKVFVVWECEIMADAENVANILKRRIYRA